MVRIRHRIAPTRWPSADEAQASQLFSPVQVGPLELKQRTWVPAMVPWRATDEGFVTEAMLSWYGRFAQGRPGAVVVEATGIRDIPSGPLLRIGHDRFVDGLRRLTDRVHEQSQGQTKVLIQLIDFLAIKRRPPQDKFLSRFLKIDEALRGRVAQAHGEARGRQADSAELRAFLQTLDAQQLQAVLSPRDFEDMRMGYRERVTDTHLPHIRELPQVLPDLFAQAALRAEQAGFDGVELHFAHAYTMASFLSRLNTREDGYGSDVQGRLRLPLEVVDAVQAKLSPQTALGCRFLADEVIEGGSRIDDAVAYAQSFAQAGLHFLSLSKGGKFEDAKQPRVGHAAYPYTGPSGHECMPTIYSDARGPVGRNLPLAKAVRAAVRAAGFDTPVVAAGALTSFEVAEGALRNGDCDIVASARQSLADPDWWRKMHLGLGDEIRRCALTNYCEGLDQVHKQVTCRLWDRELSAEEPDVLMSWDNKRRLTAPPWAHEGSDGDDG